MATEQITVIEGDGSSDTVTLTDDPVEDATVESVKQAIGDETTASEQADSTVAATLLERVTALVDALTSGQADDEVRVALAGDLLGGDLDVNLNAQDGNIEVSLNDDSLADSLDVDLTEISHGTVAVTDDGNFILSDMPATASEGGALPSNAVVVAGDDGTDTHLLQLRGDDLRVSVENDEIDLPTETTLSAVQSAVEAIDDALASNATDTLRVSTPSAIDASAAEIDVNLTTDSLAGALDVDLAAQSLSPIKVELDADSLSENLDVDIAEASAQPLDVSASTVPVEQQTPVQLEDSTNATINPATTSDVGAVESAIGDESLASQESDSALSATLIERVTALVDALTSGQADDEIRVALATDLLTGNLDVNLNAQSGSIEVDLAADSLAGSLDVDLAEISHGTVTVTDDGSFVVSGIPATASDGSALPDTAVVVAGDDGTDTRLFQLRGDDLKVSVENDQIDLPTETTLSAVKAAVEAIDDALGSNATDTIRVSSPNDLDVNLSADSLASALDVDLAGQSAAPIKVELDTDSLTGSLDVDIADQTSGALDVSATTVPVEQQSPVGVEDSDGTQIDPATSSDVGAVEGAVGDESTASQQADSTLSATLIERVTALVDALTSGQADDEVRVALATDLLAGNVDVDIANQSSGNLAIELAADSLTGNLDVDLAAQTSGALDVSGATVPTEQQTPIQLESSTGTNINPATEGTVDAIKTAAQALDDALASSGTDEIRVTSPSPLDVSASEVDVNLNSQSLQNVSVDLASDSLAGNLDVDLAAASAEPLDVSAATVSVQEDTPLDVSAAEVDVDLASQTGPALDVSGATVPVQEASALDVSAATVEVQEATALDVSASTVPTEQQSPVKIEDSSGTPIDPATEAKLENVRSLLDKLDDALASVAGDTLRTEQQTPVGVEDSTGTQIDPASNPEIRGGASLQTVVDAVEQSALAQIAEQEGASLQDVVDAIVDGALALAVDHPSETRVGLDVSSGVTIGPVPVQRAADIAVAANPTGGGDVSVTVDHTDADGNLFASDSPISAATSAQSGTVPRHGTHVRIDLSGTDTSVNFHLDTHE